MAIQSRSLTDTLLLVEAIHESPLALFPVDTLIIGELVHESPIKISVIDTITFVEKLDNKRRSPNDLITLVEIVTVLKKPAQLVQDQLIFIETLKAVKSNQSLIETLNITEFLKSSIINPKVKDTLILSDICFVSLGLNPFRLNDSFAISDFAKANFIYPLVNDQLILLEKILTVAPRYNNLIDNLSINETLVNYLITNPVVSISDLLSFSEIVNFPKFGDASDTLIFTESFIPFSILKDKLVFNEILTKDLWKSLSDNIQLTDEADFVFDGALEFFDQFFFQDTAVGYLVEC